jgi:Ca2+-binding RTX toxin-like protein
MTVLTVGADQQFKTIHDAVAASQDGDTIYVQAGTYVNDFATVNHKISLIGVGGMVHMVATQIVTKGALVVNNDLTIDHFEFSGLKSWNFNGAGIRYQAGNLTVTNSYFHDNEDGILATPLVAGTGSVTIKNSEFANNGTGDGQAHNIYIGRVANFTLTDSYSHDAIVGHEVKSRAENTTITNNRIDDGNGTSSYNIDLPNGGNALVENNIIRQGPNSQNKMMITFSAEQDHPQWANSNLVVQNNTIINDMAQAYKPVGIVNFGTGTIESQGNTIYGLTPAELLRQNGAPGGGTSTNDQFAGNAAPAVDTSHPFTTAGSLDNIVSIGIGDDVLHGTAQNDLFVGGAGQDVFVITPGGGNDVIADFNPGPFTHDTVQFVGTSFTSFDDVKAAMSQHGTDVWLDLGKGETLTFMNVDMNNFTPDDFTFATAGAATSALVSPVQVHSFTLPKPAKPTTTISGSDLKNDLLVGTSGADSIDGHKGADTMQGGAGDDHYMVDNANDLVVENPGGGNDSVISKLAAYTLPANVENLTLSGLASQLGVGNELNNVLSTGGGDSLNGMGGNDILITNGGTQLTGGEGNDIFQFSGTSGGMSTVTDFTIGQDLLDFRTVMRKYHGHDPVADHVLTLTSDGNGGTIIAIDPTHSGKMTDVVDVQHVAPTDLHMGYDYIF